MHVVVEDIEMSKYRIKQQQQGDDTGGDCGLGGRSSTTTTTHSHVNDKLFWGGFGSGTRWDSLQDDDDDVSMTSGVLKFLHITAWHKTGLDNVAKEVDGPEDHTDNMTDID